MQTKPPTWALVIGICMLVFGVIGFFNGISELATNEVMDFGQDIMDNVDGFEEHWTEEMTATRDSLHAVRDSILELSSLQNTELDSTQLAELNSIEVEEKLLNMVEGVGNIGGNMANMFRISERTMAWIKRFSYIGLFVSMMYALAGVFLFVVRRFSIPLAYLVLALSLAASIGLMTVIYTDPDSGAVSKLMGFGAIFSILVDITFLLIISFSSREAFSGLQDTEAL